MARSIWALPTMGLVVATNARAETPPPFRVESRTESTCAAATEFSAELRARSARIRPAVGSEPAIDLVLEISAGAAGPVGRLTLREPSGAVTVREVPGAGCSEIVSAMAAIAAVLIDPGASNDAVPGVPAAARPPPPGPPALPPAIPAPPPPASSGFAPRPWWLGLGFGAGVETAPLPVPAAAPSGGAVVGVRSSVWVEVRVLYAPGVSLSTRTDTGWIRWMAARIDGCPLRWPTSGPIALRPCALLEAGQLRAGGKNTPDPQKVGVRWWASGAGLKLTANAYGPLHVVLEGSAVFPWFRERFYFAPDSPENTVFRVPAVGLSGRFSLIVRLF